MNTNVFGYLAGIFSILAYVPYLHAILRDRNKPDTDPTKCRPKRASWIIWVTTSAIILATMQANASTFTLWQAKAYALGATVTFFVAIFYGEGGWKWSDRVYLGLALLGLVLWWRLHSAWYAFAIALTVDGMGIMPVLKARGRGEDPAGWVLFFLGSACNVVGTFGLKDMALRSDNPNLSDLVYPWGVSSIVSVATAFVLWNRFTNTPPSTKIN